MRTGGLMLLARHCIGWMIRGFGESVASACIMLADRIDPPAPTSVEPAPEWQPRLWDRVGARGASEARD